MRGSVIDKRGCTLRDMAAEMPACFMNGAHVSTLRPGERHKIRSSWEAVCIKRVELVEVTLETMIKEEDGTCVIRNALRRLDLRRSDITQEQSPNRPAKRQAGEALLRQRAHLRPGRDSKAADFHPSSEDLCRGGSLAHQALLQSYDFQDTR